MTAVTQQAGMRSVGVLPKMHIDPSASPGRLVGSAGDTAGEAFGRLPQGRKGSMDPMGNERITTEFDPVNRFAVEEPEAFLPAAGPTSAPTKPPDKPVKRP